MVILYPKVFEPPVGISPNSIFIKGPKEWADDLAKKLTDQYPTLTAIVSYDKFMKSWDIKHAQQAEICAFNFRNIDDDNIILLLLIYVSRFPPITYLYIDGRKSDYSYWVDIVEQCNLKIETSLPDIEKKIIADFAYLLVDTTKSDGTIKEIKKKRGRPKKEIKNESG